MPGSQVGTDFWINEYMTPWDIYQHGVTQVLAYRKTAFQEMFIVESGAYGKALVLDGKWQSSTVDEFLYHEPLVHPAMILHGAARKVLVLGGGEGATVREVLRWNSVEQAAMVDIDGEVVDACRQYLPEMHQQVFENPRCRLVIGDALDFLDTTTDQWDVIISDLSDPIESGPSFKLFTQEYFEKARRVLSPDGFFVLQAGPVCPTELGLHARLAKTLSTVFQDVLSYNSYISTYGRPWGFLLAANRPINRQPVPADVDRQLREATTGGFRLIDGTGLLGLLQTPLYIRQAIAAEEQIFSLAEPPKFFGKGVVQV